MMFTADIFLLLLLLLWVAGSCFHAVFFLDMMVFLVQESEVAEEGIPLPSDRTLCPLCSQKRVSPSVLAASGFVFCYTCICKYITQCNIGISGDSNVSQFFESDAGYVGARTMNKCKVLELLEVVQFKSPDVTLKFPHPMLKFKYEPQVEDLLKNPATSDIGGIYYYSERGDRLIDLDAFHEKLWQHLLIIEQTL